MEWELPHLSGGCQVIGCKSQIDHLWLVLPQVSITPIRTPVQVRETFMDAQITENYMSIGGSKGGARDARPPLGVQILSFSCSFWQKIDKIIPIWELAHPPGENPGSATDEDGTAGVQMERNRVKVGGAGWDTE